MYELEVQREFCAAHAILMDGVREPLHGHNWRVRIVVGGESLNDDELLCDFHWLEREIDAILQPLNNANLNETPPFNRINPTAEAIARHLGEQVAARLPAGISLISASVTEAPACRATWRP